MSDFKLSLQDFRCFEGLTFKFDAGITWITGSNASGKTSLLEAIYLLTRARSFRTAKRNEVVNLNASATIARLEFAKHKSLAVKLSNGEIQFKANRQNIKRSSELSMQLNVQFIGPHANTLVTGEPLLRRAFLDWGMFHVEPSYLPVWKNYVKALKQRNAALRSNAGNGVLEAIDSQLVTSGNQISELRLSYIDRLEQQVASTLEQLSSIRNTTLKLRSGWANDTTFGESLAKSRELDKKRMFTSVGPHRSDIAIAVENTPVKKYASSGQQKLIAIAMILAQQKYLQRDSKFLLIDDLISELDIPHSSALLDYLNKEKMNTLITSTELPKALERNINQRFHVEHRQIKSVVE